MKKIAIYIALCLIVACSDNSQQKVEKAIANTSDSLISKLDKVNDSLKGVKNDIESKIPKIKIESRNRVPITLQWIGFNKPGYAGLSKSDNGWYLLKGEQTNTSNEYLKIDGKIKRIDANRIQFIGTIITYVKYNNDGKPCEKNGEQLFLKKNNRKYYRLQKMTNCEGGRLLDYVDLYNLDNYL